jgi:hypothetical protein
MLLDDVIAEVKSNDILIKINAIEMLMEVCKWSYELRWDLEKKFDHHCTDGSLPAWLSIHEASQSVGLYSGLDEK